MKTLTDFNRREINFTESKISDTLPDFYKSEYPNLIAFLDKYYQFMDSDENYNFAKAIHELYQTRDIEDTNINYLDTILKELGQGLLNTNFFLDPRFATRLVSKFYRVKGSLYSGEGFFRGFYGSQVTIEYPKRNIFIVGESLIGPDSLRYIQNGALYQIYSILVKSEIPFSTWQDLYKKFVHPAGFFLGAETVLVGSVDLGLDSMPNVILVDSSTATTAAIATLDPSGVMEIAALTDSNGTYIKYSVEDYIIKYENLTIEQLINQYNSIEQLIEYTSPTFDQDSVGATVSIDMSNTLETTDQNKSRWWSDDSDIYQSQLP